MVKYILFTKCVDSLLLRRLPCDRFQKFGMKLYDASPEIDERFLGNIPGVGIFREKL